MRELAATIADGTHVLRTVTLAQWVLRALTLAAIAGAAVSCLAWFPFGHGAAACAVLVALGLGAVVFPDSWAPTAAIAGVAAWWVLAGAGAPWWQAVVMALLLAAFHLGVGVCASAPPWAHGRGGAVRAWLASFGVFLGLSVVAVGVVVAFGSLTGDGGLVWVILGAAGLLGAAVWARKAVAGP